jgi:hypothetical protein
MPVDGIGSGVIIVLAALLWLAYLVPSWLRRREYLATERNALRLQQTLRVMAESAEIPEAIRVEATARSAARQEKVLREQLQRTEAVARAEDAVARAQDAAAARAAARRLAEVQPAIAADVASSSTASRRLRRSRAITSLVLLAALVTGGVGVAQLLASGAWMLLAIGAAVAVGSFAMLGQMASVSRTRAELARGLRARPVPVVAVAEKSRAQDVPLVVPASSWTPVPLPKPLYSRPQVARARELSLDAAAELRQAAADSEARIRRAESEPEVTPFRRPAPAASPVAAPSRFARMGFVDVADSGKTDLDAVFARRRSAAS